MKKLVLTLSCASMMLAACQSDLKLREDNIDEIIAAMTLEEKAGLCVGVGYNWMEGTDAGWSIQAKVPGAAGTTMAIERLGIPAIQLCDGPAGLRIQPTREGDEATYYCTHFPIGTLLSSTWDQELVENVGKAMGQEVLEYGADVLLAPALNIHRNPLCGRNFEYYSEDPVVAGKIAAAYVKGVQSNGVGTSIKHFAFNNQETNRLRDNAILSERAAREIYLKGFEIAVKEAQPMTVMTSYNMVNDVYTSESYDLNTTILRDEWGFQGVVMTDWTGGYDAAKNIHAGNEMIQPGNKEKYDQIINAVKENRLPMEELDQAVRRILEMVVKCPGFKNYQYSNKPDLQGHAAVTRQSATEGMVLLENKGALPLKDVKKVALIGVTAYNWIAGGTGSGDVNRAYTVNLTEGLKNAGLEADATIQGMYDGWIKSENARLDSIKATMGGNAWMFNETAGEMDPAQLDLTAAAQANDVAIVVIGRNSGEGSDRNVENFELSAFEQGMIKNATAAFHAAGKKAIVILNIGGAIESASWKNIPDAVLCAWQGGQEGGNSVADVITGKANPSGKLPMTWPVKFTDHKSSANFPINQGVIQNPSIPAPATEVKDVDYTNYEEGIYVGYRWFDTQNIAVSYPFGYGLSYTTFTYAAEDVKAEGDTYTVEVTVTNNGEVAGKEVVELYVSAPAATMDKPAQELKAFAKTPVIEPGKSAKVTLTVKADELASYNEATSSWEVEAGTYTFKVGASS
ncbi:MAG: glycoside hydrolase family 3 C-terminal domain-containing protein, partial [Bacteroidales bacterium]|nr:glycoside hydrolase family 3 C-terminal domain-containing protein [Bacteroidales bacterium]